MTVKQLKWVDNVTDLGKAQNIVEFTAYDKVLKILFTISNRITHWNNDDKLLQLYGIDGFPIGLPSDNIDELKVTAQEEFEKLIYRLFFVQ